jgi:hypothetical protein
MRKQPAADCNTPPKKEDLPKCKKGRDRGTEATSNCGINLQHDRRMGHRAEELDFFQRGLPPTRAGNNRPRSPYRGHQGFQLCEAGHQVLATMALRPKSICQPALHESFWLFWHAVYASESSLLARLSSGARPEAKPACVSLAMPVVRSPLAAPGAGSAVC